MKYAVVLFVLALFAATAFAQDERQGSFKLLDLPNFAAPVVGNPSTLTNQPVGTIVFNGSTGQFMGLDDAGNWNAFNWKGGNVVLSGGTESTNRATFAEGSPCTSDPCSAFRQSGTWLSRIDRVGPGQYGLEINTGVFSDNPACTATANAGWVNLGLTSNTPGYVRIETRDFTGTLVDLTNINVICEGSR